MAFSKCGAFTDGKGWRRSIGVKVGHGGKLIPARWWLGMDKPKASSLALQIESLWVGLDAPYWTAEAWAIAEGLRVGATAKDSPESTVGATKTATTTQTTLTTATVIKPIKPTTVLTVNGLIERFRTAYKADARLTRASKHSMACRTVTLERSPIGNTPLAGVGAEQLASLISFWLQRPTTGRGEAISEYSARMVVKTARTVFDWADGAGLWIAPRRFDRIFRLPRKAKQPTFKVFSVDDLASLYRVASDEMKLVILLSLNCGFCSAEIASLRKDEIDLKAKTIKRARQKTGIVGTWHLWDETVKALSIGMAKEGELALLTGGGKPLMFYADNGQRIDVLPKRWGRLMKNANKLRAEDQTPIVGAYKTLRKTGATMIRAIAGIEVSEMYLAHSEKSMAKYYSTPSQDKLTTALKALRKQLAPVFKQTKASKGKDSKP